MAQKTCETHVYRQVLLEVLPEGLPEAVLDGVPEHESTIVLTNSPFPSRGHVFLAFRLEPEDSGLVKVV